MFKLKKKNFLMTLLLVLSLPFVTGAVYARQATLVGDWLTSDGSATSPSSIVHIWKSETRPGSHQWRYYGKVIKINPVPGGPRPLKYCNACKPPLQGKAIMGMVILSDLQPVSPNEYVNGRILDPRSGQVYHCKVNVNTDGQSLQLRGYVGTPILGRSVIWTRVYQKN